MKWVKIEQLERFFKEYLPDRSPKDPVVPYEYEFGWLCEVKDFQELINKLKNNKLVSDNIKINNDYFDLKLTEEGTFVSFESLKAYFDKHIKSIEEYTYEKSLNGLPKFITTSKKEDWEIMHEKVLMDNKNLAKLLWNYLDE